MTTASTPCRAAIYVRISQDREGGGLGVERQREDCQALADRLGWTVAEVYTDNDVSAYSGQPRKGYRRLLDDVKAGRVDGILAWHTDRLHRRPVELEEFVDVCGDRVAIQTVKAGELDLATPSGRMVARMLGASARYESEHKAERVSAKRREAAKAGKWSGGMRPFGFEPDGVTIRESEPEEIRKATRHILNGGSLRSTVRDLNERGITTSTGKQWSSMTVRDMLVRPRNSGKIKYQPTERRKRDDGREVVVPNRSVDAFGDASWEPIISEDERLAVAAILQDPERKQSPGNQVRYLGSHLYICGYCGSRDIVASTPGGKGRNGTHRPTQYRCRNRETSGAKNHLARNAAKVDELVTAAIVEWLTAVIATYKLSDDPAPIPDNDPEWSKLTAELSAIETRRTEIQEDYADGVMTRADFRSMIDRLKSREENVRSRMSTGPETQVIPWADIETPEDVRPAWEAQSIEQQRKLVREVLDVTILPSANRGPVFDPESVKIEVKVDPRQVRPTRKA